VFGWLCGYSADADFLNQALERFTLETAGQRAHRGRVSLALILDPCQPALGPVEVPGLAHLPLRRADRGRSGCSTPSLRCWVSAGPRTARGGCG
jgi:hypothetical protein